MHNERLAADNKMDRMAIWMRNVERMYSPSHTQLKWLTCTESCRGRRGCSPELRFILERCNAAPPTATSASFSCNIPDTDLSFYASASQGAGGQPNLRRPGRLEPAHVFDERRCLFYRRECGLGEATSPPLTRPRTPARQLRATYSQCAFTGARGHGPMQTSSSVALPPLRSSN